jgi:hypothetical protein
MMSTGLALSTVSAVLGLSHGKVAEAEYSYLMAAIVGSAVVPAIAANVLFVPRQLLLPGSHAAASSGHESSEQN